MPNRKARRKRLAIARSGKTRKAVERVESLAMRIFEDDTAVKMWLVEKKILGENTPLELLFLGAGAMVEQFLLRRIKELASLPVEERGLEMMKYGIEDAIPVIDQMMVSDTPPQPVEVSSQV